MDEGCRGAHWPVQGERAESFGDRQDMPVAFTHSSEVLNAHTAMPVCRLISVENAISFVSPVLIASAILFAHVRARASIDNDAARV
jgi:hypothetical protein